MKKTSIYATAAYDRALFSKPLGHLVQWKDIAYEIDKFRQILCWALFYYGDNPKPTDKELSISQFKGFTDSSLENCCNILK